MYLLDGLTLHLQDQFFSTVVIDLVNELSPFILICSPSINVPDT